MPQPIPSDAAFLSGRGVDIGTANIAHCRLSDVKQFHIDSIRDCFLALPADEQTNLGHAGVLYTESEDHNHLLIVDQEAAQLAAAMGMELRRPLAQGFISDKEDLSKEVVRLILTSLLGEPSIPGELAVYSVPGEPFDSRTPKAQYHTRFFASLLKEMGYTPMAINEAMAVCFNETMYPESPEYAPLSGLCFSFGAGMINVALVLKSLCLRSFSIPLGGDWIDEAAAKATNSPLAQVTLLKEEGLDLMNSRVVEARTYHDAVTHRQAEALCLMYQELLSKLRDTLNKFFSRPENRLDIRTPIPVIVSGGTSRASGFLQLFDEIVLEGLETRLPIDRHATQAKKPMEAVAMGAMQFARLRSESAKG